MVLGIFWPCQSPLLASLAASSPSSWRPDAGAPGLSLWYWCLHSLWWPSLMALTSIAMLMSPNLISATWTFPLMPDLHINCNPPSEAYLQSPWIHISNVTYTKENSWFPSSQICTSLSLSLCFSSYSGQERWSHSWFLIQPPDSYMLFSENKSRIWPPPPYYSDPMITPKVF